MTPRACAVTHPFATDTAATCPACRDALKAAGVAGRPAPAPLPQPCVHLGVILVPCHSCGGRRDIRDCDVHGTCTPTPCGKDVDMTCDRCRRDGLGYTPGTAIAPH